MKEKSKRIKENKAITLIALVVTIVVLIILAGISIGALTGNNGIINQTQNAKEQTEIADEKERIDLLIKSICEIQNEKKKFILKIIGISKEMFEKNYTELKDLKNYEERIKYYGKLSHKETIEELKKSDFSVIPREKKINNIAGFPTKLGESFCAQIPVITTLVGDIEEYIVEEENGFIFFDCSINSMKEKIEYILNNELYKKSYDILHNRLDYNDYCEKVEIFLQNLKKR